MCMFLILCCFGSCRQPQDRSLICLFFLLCFGSSSEQWGAVLKGCAGWFCSLTNEVEAGAELSSQGAGLWLQVCRDSDAPSPAQSSELPELKPYGDDHFPGMPGLGKVLEKLQLSKCALQAIQKQALGYWILSSLKRTMERKQGHPQAMWEF